MISRGTLYNYLLKKNNASFGFRDFLFQLFAFSLLFVSAALLMMLLVDVFGDGLDRLSWSFLTSYPSRIAERAGIFSALVGSVYLIILTGIFALPLGIGAAVYLEEYAQNNRFTRLIELNIANLAGVPSIIYGILGLQIFVRFFGFERSLLSGALTMALLIQPIIVIASREALRQVPQSLRQAALALGATQWQAIRDQVLPAALPGIMTGCILAFSRAIGETAPLVAVGALAYVAYVPDGVFSEFTALPIQAFNWISRPQEAFHKNAAGAIVVLLSVLLLMNSLAISIRYRYQKGGKKL